MRKIFSVLQVALITFVLISCTTVKKNPLFMEFDAEHGTPPYSEIKNEHFYPAFELAINSAKLGINKIVSNPDAPTFENTIEAMEFNGAGLATVSGVFYNLIGSHTNDTLDNISIKVSGKLSDLDNYTMLNEELFRRVKSVYDNMEDLTDIEKRLTTKTYKSFTRNGAELSADDKKRYGEIAKRLSELSLKFGKNNREATNSYWLEIAEEQLKGLPQFVVDMAKEDAKAKGVDGWVITMQGPSYSSFMQYSPNSKLKEILWKKSSSLCLGGEYDNTEIVNEIVNLRLEQANVMGYSAYADYILEETMAKDAKTVNEFLAEISDKSMSYAKKDVGNVTAFAKRNGFRGAMMPWDISYYSNKLKEAKYSISDEELKPYFELENVKKGTFDLFSKLYGIKFVENVTAEPYQEDVTIYNVLDKDDTLLSVLYLDFFPRESKNSGAWMSTIRDQKIVNGVESRPLVTVVCNFTKPTSTTPSLLTHGEVVVLLHEFGHAIHGIFATGKYPSLSGTAVARDFVELPSQVMESWATQKDFLTTFAKHYQTGEVIPQTLIDKIIASKNFNAGYSNSRQLSFGLLDMAWHSISEKGDYDVPEFERRAKAPVDVLPVIKGTGMTPVFGHIFAGGYAAGYYSYKWAEVLDADAFEAFKEVGIFSRELGDKFRKEVLSQGGNKDAMELFVNFRGHKPEIDALFKKYGF